MQGHLGTSGFAVLVEESSLMRAHWVAGGIEAAGIPTHVEEDNLADEFSMSRKMMGAHPIRVLVPAYQLDEARLVLQGMSQPIPLVDEDGDEDDFELDLMDVRRRDRRTTFAVILIALLFGGPLLGYLVTSLFGGF